MTAARTCSAGPTSGRSTPCCGRQPRSRAKLSALTDAEGKLKGELDAAIKRGQVLAGLDQTSEFAEIDWQSTVNRIAELKDEHAKLKAASAELARLDAELETVKGQIAEAEPALANLDGKLGAIDNKISDAKRGLADARPDPRRARLRAPPGRTSPRSAPCWRRPATSRRGTAAACDKAETTAAAVIGEIAERRGVSGRHGSPPASSTRWASSAASTRWRHPSSTTPSSPRPATGSCTSGSPTTTCPASSSSSRRT